MAEKRKKLKQAVPLGNIINTVLANRMQKKDAGLLQVWQHWDAAVGDVIADNARPAAFKGNLLLVHVNSSPWMHQLQFLKKEIIEKVNNALGDDLVADIKFKIGPLD
jgi:predicted nucleic acid-binding Zn ribbon protein